MFDSGACSTSKRGCAASRACSVRVRVAQLIVERSDPGGAVALERQPELERVGAARALKAAHALIARTLLGRRRERDTVPAARRRLQIALVTHQDEPGGEREQHHLVRIPGERAARADAAQPMAVRAESSADAPCAPSTCSQTPRASHRRADRLQVVEGSGGRRAGGGDHGHDRACRLRQPRRASRERGGSIRYSRDGMAIARCACRVPARRRRASPRSARARRRRTTGGIGADAIAPASGMAAARAASSAVKVASVPPEVSVPPASRRSPPARTSSAPRGARSRVSRRRHLRTRPATGSAPPISDSVHIAAGSGADTWCPMYIG